MIHEKFLVSAVNIRRTYLKVSDDLNVYHEKAKDMLDILNKTVSDIDSLKETVVKANSGKTKMTDQEALQKLLKIIQGVEDEGKSIENITDPLNKQIEKLAKEEQELYEQIKMAHPNLSDEQIVTSVRNRLIQEGLVEDSVMNSARYISRRN
jgi:predicted  nucleic acid-binding Zn-ribbon protein